MSLRVEARRARAYAMALRAIAALLLLASIAADLASDSRCHPLAPLAPGASVRAAADSTDACADGCVPDCYCCSTVSPTALFRLAGAECQHAPFAGPADPSAASGVSPAPYRPPLEARLS
jgi:hypothetical protein